MSAEYRLQLFNRSALDDVFQPLSEDENTRLSLDVARTLLRSFKGLNRFTVTLQVMIDPPFYMTDVDGWLEKFSVLVHNDLSITEYRKRYNFRCAYAHARLLSALERYYPVIRGYQVSAVLWVDPPSEEFAEYAPIYIRATKMSFFNSHPRDPRTNRNFVGLGENA